MAKRKDKPQSPAQQALGAGKGGIVPPEKYRFKPGESGNPSGQKQSAGWSVQSWLNQMQEWPRSKIEDLLNDDAAPVNKRAAARVWLHATSDTFNAAGSPIAGPEFDRIMDRTLGKPQQSLDLTTKGEKLLLPMKLEGDKEISS